MLRSRVRRSFTVEIKSKSRQTPPWPENPAPSPVNWAALEPAKVPSLEASSFHGTAAPASPVAAEKPRRILPSLIVAEPEPEAPEPVAEREPRLPRVRRVKPPPARSEAPRAGTSWSLADVYDAAPGIPAAPPRQAPPQPVSVVPVSAPARKVMKPWAAEPAFGPGERWKRRLPRACR